MTKQIVPTYIFLAFALLIAAATFFVSGCKEDVTPSMSCSYMLSATSFTIPADGSSGTVQVTTVSSCSWTAVSNTPWIRIVSGQSGVGNGTVSYEVTANTGESRTGSLAIAGQTITLSQARIRCIYQLSPVRKHFGTDGGSGTLRVQTSAECTWTASSDLPWIRIVSGSEGSGNGTIQYTVESNQGSLRQGNILVADKTFEIEQLGTVTTFSISGNTKAPKIEINFEGPGAPPPVLTDTSGNFIQTGFSNGRYVVRPFSHCFTFDPARFTVLVSNQNVRNINFNPSFNIIADAGGPYFQFSGSSITFSALKSKSLNPIRSYSWEFGDGKGKVCDCPTVQHTYSEDDSPCPDDLCTRNLIIRLTIRDVNGCAASDTAEIEVTYGY